MKAGADRILVIGGIKVRRHGALLRAVRHVRDVSGFQGEWKFSQINQGSLSSYYAIIEELEKSDAHLIATVSKRPKGSTADWKFYANLHARLIQGNVNQREHVGVLMDMVSTPKDVPFEDVLKGMVNSRLRRTSVTTAVCLDSRCSDGLQIADLIAGAIAFERRVQAGGAGKEDSQKARVVNRLKASFGLTELSDIRRDRVNIQSWTPGVNRKSEKDR